VSIAELSIGHGIQLKDTAADGAGWRLKLLKAEQPAECGGERGGLWMFWRRMMMRELRDVFFIWPDR
jgi:hypothetical protein